MCRVFCCETPSAAWAACIVSPPMRTVQQRSPKVLRQASSFPLAHDLSTWDWRQSPSHQVRHGHLVSRVKGREVRAESEQGLRAQEAWGSFLRHWET